MKPKTTCPRCDGAGEIELTGVYLETLSGLKRLTKAGRGVVAGRDWKWFGCNQPTALNNRLDWLEKHGLARSERYGRERRFWAT
jgi:hypothetical protein